jgi:ABC-type nitrate/sulfonate/bicarbonate transport system substrate-binding protein
MLQHAAGSGRLTLTRIGLSMVFGAALLAMAGSTAGAQSSVPAGSVKIVVGQNNNGPNQLPMYLALQDGFFQKAGMDVTAVQLSGGTPSAMAAFASGSVNILTLSVPEVIEYIGRKAISGKIFGEMIDQNYDLLTAKNITNIQDIKGKTLGISGPNGGDWISFMGLLQHYGIDPKDVTFITAGNIANRVTALAAGSIQATLSSNISRDISAQTGNILLKSEDMPAQFPANVLVASKDLIDNHKSELKKFLAVMADATQWIKANNAEAIAKCMKYMGATEEVCSTTIKLSVDRSVSSPYTWSNTWALNVEGSKEALSLMAKIQTDTQNLTIDDIADTSIAGTKP